MVHVFFCCSNISERDAHPHESKHFYEVRPDMVKNGTFRLRLLIAFASKVLPYWRANIKIPRGFLRLRRRYLRAAKKVTTMSILFRFITPATSAKVVLTWFSGKGARFWLTKRHWSFYHAPPTLALLAHEEQWNRRIRKIGKIATSIGPNTFVLRLNAPYKKFSKQNRPYFKGGSGRAAGRPYQMCSPLVRVTLMFRHHKTFAIRPSWPLHNIR